jgi:hypothetical protein
MGGKMLRVVGSLCVAVALAGCAGLSVPGGGAPAPGGGPGLMSNPPTASPGCDARNICRVYVAMEKDSTGREQIYVYPDTLHTNTGRRDAHIVWIILNDDVNFSAPKTIQIQRGDPTQWTDKYPTDSDAATRRAPVSGRRTSMAASRAARPADTYKYAITVQRGTDAPVTKDPTIVNSN